MISATSAKPGNYELQTRPTAARTSQNQKDEGSGRQIGAFGEKLLSYAEDGPFKDLSSDFLKGMESDLEVGNRLQQAADSMEDNMRSDKISKLKTRIAELKERLKFATPQQAKALLRELKQISKEFKLAAQSLSGGSGANLAVGTGTAATSQISASSQTETLSIDSVEAGLEAPLETLDDGSLQATLETLLEHDVDPADLEVLAAGFAQLEQQAGDPQDHDPGNHRSGGTEEGTDEDGPAAGGTGPNQKGLAAAMAVREGIAAYTNTSHALNKQEGAESSGNDSAAVRRAHAEELRKIGKEIKNLAEQIKALMDKDDRDQKEDMKKALSDLQKGYDALDKFELESASTPSSQDTSTRAVTAVQVDQTAAISGSPSLQVSVPANFVA